jgi:hypothetical protein
MTAEEGLALTMPGRAFQTGGARMVLRARRFRGTVVGQLSGRWPEHSEGRAAGLAALVKVMQEP